MRGKNKLFTAITAGIIFLSGIIIVAKNTLMKKYLTKKDYIPTLTEENERIRTEACIADPLQHQLEQVQPVITEERPIQTVDGESYNERMLLLQMVNELVQKRQTEKVNYTVNKVIRNHERKRVENTTQAAGLILTHQEKMGYKIREPSKTTGEKSSLEIVDNDKGG